MQWTQFGRVGTSLDSIPRAKIENRRISKHDVEHDFERDFAKVVQETRPPRTEESEVEQTPAAKAQGARDTTEQAHDETTPEASDSTSAQSRDVSTTEQASAELPGDGEDLSPMRVSTEDASSAEGASDTRTAPGAGSVTPLGVTPPLTAPVLVTAPQAVQAAASQAPSIGAARLDAATTAARVVRSATAHSVRNTTPAIMTEEQHAHLLRRIALAASETGGEMRLLLEPANLGALGVRLRIDGNVLRLELRAENGDVAALLERDAARLKQDLTERGLDVQDLDIGTSTRDEQQSAQRDFENEHSATREFLDEIDESGTRDAQELMSDATDAIFDAVRHDSFQPDSNSSTRVVIDTIA